MTSPVSEPSVPDETNERAPTERHERPDLLAVGRGKLSFIERLSIRLVRSTFEPTIVDRILRFLQRTIGQGWIHFATRKLLRIHGQHFLGALDEAESVLVVANHRSFFDLYVITAELVRRGLKKRIIFPVRSGFFYDSLLGLPVNFAMSFLAMYPPIFRDRKKAALNLASLDELGFLLARGGLFVGLHPEGTRNKSDDSYALLPAQPGVGRVIHKSGVRVVPVFVNGLGNDLVRQVVGNFTGKGPKIHVVFGAPVEFDALLEQKGSPRVYREVSERCLEAIRALGEDEKRFRAEEEARALSN